MGMWEGSGYGEVGRVWEGDDASVEAPGGIHFYFAAERRKG